MSKTRYTLSADDLIKSELLTKSNAEALLAGLNASGATKQLAVALGGTGASAFTNQKLIYYDAVQRQFRSSTRGVSETIVPGSLPPSGPAGGDLAGTYPDPTIGNQKIKAVNLFPAGGANGQLLSLVGGELAWIAQAVSGSRTLLLLTPGNYRVIGLAPDELTLVFLKGGAGASGQPLWSSHGSGGSERGGPGGSGGTGSAFVKAGPTGKLTVSIGAGSASGAGDASAVSNYADGVGGYDPGLRFLTAVGTGGAVGGNAYDRDGDYNSVVDGGGAGANGTFSATDKFLPSQFFYGEMLPTFGLGVPSNYGTTLNVLGPRVAGTAGVVILLASANAQVVSI